MRPIFILSKGRPNPLTSQLFQAANIKHFIFIEPQDWQFYDVDLPPTAELVDIGENDRGITFVRQRILDQIRKIGTPCWMIDDDIFSVSEVELYEGGKIPKRKIKSEPSDVGKLFERMERDFEAANVCYGAPEIDAWALYGNHIGLIDSKFESNVVYIDPRLISPKCNYEGLSWKGEDITFAARAGFEGGIVRTHASFVFSTKEIGGKESRGGLAPMYDGWSSKVDAANAAMQKMLDDLRDEYLPLLTPEQRKKFGDKKLWRHTEFRNKARKGQFDTRAAWSHITLLYRMLQENRNADSQRV